MKNHILRFLTLTLIAILIYSCDQDDEFEIKQTEPTQIEQPDGIPTVLGKKLEIPFTVENMQIAYDNLKNNKSFRKSARYSKMDEGLEIETSHYYYRFLPKDSLQYERLVNDTILQVSEVPFEYDVEINGDYYKDPTVQNSDFTYYYSVFPVDHDFPQAIEHEKIAHLYFPPEDENEELEEGEIAVEQPLNITSKKLLATFDGDFFDNLETEALRITDNLDDEELSELNYITSDKEILTYQQVKAKGYSASELKVDYSKKDGNRLALFGGSKWSPSGRITVEEGALTRIGSRNNVVGVMGAEIKVRKWGFLVIRRARTDRNGYFRTSSTRTRSVKYACYFNHQPNFTVKAGTWFWNARDRGTRTHKHSSWNRHYTSGRSQFYAFIQNAAYDYYNRIVSTYSISRPPIFINISAEYNLCGSSQHRIGILQLLPISRIRITRKQGNCSYRGSDGIYATTVHELTHAGHNRLDPGMFSLFSQGSCERAFLTESWAEGVETIVTNDRYNALTNNYQSTQQGDFNGRWNSGRQNQTVANMTEYTPIVDDLIDNINQNVTVGNTRPIDRVRGYNLDKIERALDNCRTITSWENSLRTKIYNSTEGNLKELFNYVRAARYNSNSNRCD